MLATCSYNHLQQQFERCCHSGDLISAEKYARNMRLTDFTIFEMVCGCGNLEAAQWIYSKYNTQIPCNSVYFRNALHLAIVNNHLPIVQWMNDLDCRIVSCKDLFRNACIFNSADVATWFMVSIPDWYTVVILNQRVFDWSIIEEPETDDDTYIDDDWRTVLSEHDHEIDYMM